MLETLRLDRRRFVQATGLAVLAGAVTGSQATAAADDQEPPVDAGDVFDHLDKAAISVFARDLETGAPIADSGSRRPVPPASTTKLLTTAASFDALGPDYRFETTIGAVGDRRGGAVVESLGVVARGDPDVMDTELTQLAEAVADAGVRRVTDGLIVDVSAFDGGEHAPAWTLGDAQFWYGKKSSAFTLSRNTVGVTVSRPDNSCSLEVDVSPDSGVIDVEVDVECVDEGNWLSVSNPDHRTNTVRATGELAPGGEVSGFAPVGEPNRHAAAALIGALEDAGVRVGPQNGDRDAAITIADEPIELSETFGVLESDSLSEIATGLNFWSRNMVAENVARAVAVEREGVGSWANWESYLADVLEDAGAETPQIRDGSGLSRHDLASARDVVSMIEWGLEAEWGDTFRETIPIAGEEGTVRNRLEDVDATVRAKSGSLRGVTCLAGVVEDDDEEPAASFAVLAANLTGERASGASSRVDELVAKIAEEASSSETGGGSAE